MCLTYFWNLIKRLNEIDAEIINLNEAAIVMYEPLIRRHSLNLISDRGSLKNG